MAASFQILSSSSFISHFTIRRYVFLDTDSIVKNLHKGEHCIQLVYKLLRNVLDVDVNFA